MIVDGTVDLERDLPTVRLRAHSPGVLVVKGLYSTFVTGRLLNFLNQ